MSDNIILLGTDLREKIKRTVAVLKARGTAHDLGLHEFEIDGRGAHIK